MKVGKGCSFYHEGGHGDRRWVVGWRYGVIRAIPIKGRYKKWVQIEIQVRRYGWDALKDGVIKKGWTPRPFERVWVHSSVVNEPGDFSFHGLTDVEVSKERKEEKSRQQKKADKRKAGKAKVKRAA